MSPANLDLAGARVIETADDARLIDVATMAVRHEMHVIYAGDRLVVCSIIPPGWKKLSMGNKVATPKLTLTPANQRNLPVAGASNAIQN